MTPRRMQPIERIPDEIKLKISSHLSTADLRRASMTYKSLCGVFQQRMFKNVKITTLNQLFALANVLTEAKVLAAWTTSLNIVFDEDRLNTEVPKELDGKVIAALSTLPIDNTGWKDIFDPLKFGDPQAVVGLVCSLVPNLESVAMGSLELEWLSHSHTLEHGNTPLEMHSFKRPSDESISEALFKNVKSWSATGLLPLFVYDLPQLTSVSFRHNNSSLCLQNPLWCRVPAPGSGSSAYQSITRLSIDVDVSAIYNGDHGDFSQDDLEHYM
ncbi:hypothetical protein CC80DRAFT_505442 [Byssothecium circinans]|uniref:F-box domain-containing protein n=1 Tax=Byssothecium circinans TaxID=147558 RepID=A0A6A5TTD5_9PLEO|nr:hypothetical protein CC80DRAFT_505442 [Byssothecium circinans]